MKKLANLNWTLSWTSIIGSVHGCLKYLGVDPGFSWLYGGTGHAFIINMSQDGSCPSGPTAWNTAAFFELGKNLGYQIEGVLADKRKPGWKEKQAEAWLLARTALDNDTPVFGWELAIPEFYVVDGYDEVGYYYKGPGAENSPSPKPWQELGVSGIGLLEIYSVKPEHPADDRQVVREALEFAVSFNGGSSDWVLPDYLTGLAAYDVWFDAVKTGQADLMGHAYNAAVWEECRRNSVAFLREAKKRLDGLSEKAFTGAIQAYSEVAKHLKDMSELYPFFENNREEPLGTNPRSQKAADYLQSARRAEEEGLARIKEIIGNLS